MEKFKRKFEEEGEGKKRMRKGERERNMLIEEEIKDETRRRNTEE